MLDGSKVDLMICDVHMPRMDGLTFVREVKRLAEYRFVPVIMLTTESSEKSRLAGLQAGAKAWVVKPFRPDQRSEEHTSELQSLTNLVCRLLLEKKKKRNCKIMQDR